MIVCSSRYANHENKMKDLEIFNTTNKYALMMIQAQGHFEVKCCW